MYSGKLKEQIFNAIKIYDELCGREYFILYSYSKEKEPEFVELRFEHFNFWHLIGCKIEDTNESKLEIYDRVLNQTATDDIFDRINQIYGQKEIYQKVEVIKKVFNFVKMAKVIGIGKNKISPESFQFEMGIGNDFGIIGYDKDKKNRGKSIPKTTRDKRLKELCKTKGKILFILSKNINDNTYSNLEYEIKKEILDEYKYILEENNISFHIPEDEKAS